MDLIKPINTRFSHPARIVVCGPSNSGKTTLVMAILHNWQTFFHHPVTKVVWYYGVYQPGYDKLAKKGVLLREGVPEDIQKDFPTAAPSNETYIIVLDDLMKEATKDGQVLDIFTKHSHHRNITAFMLTQNLYHQGRHSVDITRNVSVAIFIVEMRNIRVLEHFLHSGYDKQQVRQIMAWIRETTFGKPYSNFMIDFSPATHDEHRLRINILPSREHGFTQIFVPSLIL